MEASDSVRLAPFLSALTLHQRLNELINSLCRWYMLLLRKWKVFQICLHQQHQTVKPLENIRGGERCLLPLKPTKEQFIVYFNYGHFCLLLLRLFVSVVQDEM